MENNEFFNKNITKKCFKCKEMKDISEYYTFKSGKLTYCKKCSKIKRMEHYHNKGTHQKWSEATLSNHKIKGIKINIGYKPLRLIAIDTKYCPICGIKFNWKDKKGLIGPYPNYPTLDRTNNSKTISAYNTNIICAKCNTMKGAFTMEQFLLFCSKIHNENKEIRYRLKQQRFKLRRAIKIYDNSGNVRPKRIPFRRTSE